jgi:hypothetical protein
VGEKVTLADSSLGVQPFGGKVIETNLDEKDVKSLREALRMPSQEPSKPIPSGAVSVIVAGARRGLTTSRAPARSSAVRVRIKFRRGGPGGSGDGSCRGVLVAPRPPRRTGSTCAARQAR